MVERLHVVCVSDFDLVNYSIMSLVINFSLNGHVFLSLQVRMHGSI